MCRRYPVPSVESSSREQRRRPHIVSLNFVNTSKSGVFLLDYRAHEITLPAHNREDFWLQHPRCAGVHCHGEWVAQPRAIVVGFYAFSCERFAPVVVEGSSQVARRSSSITSATSLTLLPSVDVLGLPGLGWLSMLTQQPRKRLALRKTALRFTMHSPRTSLEASWISVEFLLHNVSILMYDL